MKMSNEKEDAVESNEKTVLVGVNIDRAELEQLKFLTGVDKNACAIMSAARQGAKMLAKMNSALDKTIAESVSAQQ
jgi:uncharacterized metal-binding protein